MTKGRRYNARPVVIKGRYYPSMREAARQLNTNFSAVYFNINGKQPPHKRLCKPGWRYATPARIKRYNK